MKKPTVIMWQDLKEEIEDNDYFDSPKELISAVSMLASGAVEVVDKAIDEYIVSIGDFSARGVAGDSVSAGRFLIPTAGEMLNVTSPHGDVDGFKVVKSELYGRTLTINAVREKK